MCERGREERGLEDLDLPTEREPQLTDALERAVRSTKLAAAVLQSSFNNPTGALTPDAAKRRIVAALGQTPVEVDEIIRFTGIRPAVVHLVLLELALAGRIERMPGQRIALIG